MPRDNGNGFIRTQQPETTPAPAPEPTPTPAPAPAQTCTRYTALLACNPGCRKVGLFSCECCVAAAPPPKPEEDPFARLGDILAGIQAPAISVPSPTQAVALPGGGGPSPLALPLVLAAVAGGIYWYTQREKGGG